MVVRLFSPWVGGMERQAYKLALGLRARDIDVKIVTGWWFRGTSRSELMDGLPVFRNFTCWECFGIKGLRKFGACLYIVTLMWHLWRRRSEYDVIHVHGLSYHTFAAVVAGRWCARPVVVKLANSGPASDIVKMRSGQHLALSRFMLPTALDADRFIALNKLIVDELVQAGVPPARILEIPNGVPIETPTTRSDYALHRPARLVFVGRLHHQKGVDVLLAAIQRLRCDATSGEFRLTLVGDGPLRAQLEALTRRLAIDSQVEFVGESNRVQDYLRESDIFVLPSRAEGISNSLLEAMAQGLPAVASNIPGNADVIDNERTGLLFKPNDAESLAVRLDSLLRSSSRREKIGKAARREIEAGYGIGRIAERYIGLYQSLLPRTSRSGAGERHLARRLA